MVDIDNYNIQMTNSVIHNLSYISKVLLFLFVILFIIFADSSMDLYMINLFLLVIVAWCNISLRAIIKNISFFGVFIFLFLFFLSLISFNLYLSFFWTMKIIDVIILLSLIGFTTSFYGLVIGCECLFRPFRFFLDVNRFSIKFASFLKFMAVMYAERERIYNSKKFRGVKFDKMDLVDKIDYLLREMLLVIRFSLKKVDCLKINVYKNKYGLNSYKYNYRLNKWKKADTIMLIVNVLMLFIVFVY